MSQDNPSYVFIGDIKRKKMMTEYSLEQSMKKHRKEANVIFERLYRTGDYHLNQRNQLKANDDGDYYFIVTDPALFFLIFAKSGNENKVFKMIDTINQEHIPLMTNDNGELNAQGRQALKGVIEKFEKENVSKTSEIQEEINSIRIDMKDNIEHIMTNMDGLDTLKEKSDHIKDMGSAFKNNAAQVKKVTWWQNIKLIIIIVVMIILLLLAIILPIVLKKK